MAAFWAVLALINFGFAMQNTRTAVKVHALTGNDWLFKAALLALVASVAVCLFCTYNLLVLL